ncbi:MAG: hypothetical protein R3E82_15590 [Pseudomonadales bacterium]
MMIIILIFVPGIVTTQSRDALAVDATALGSGRCVLTTLTPDVIRIGKSAAPAITLQ